MLRVFLLSFLLSLVTSRLILPHQIPGILEMQNRLMNTSLKTRESPRDSNSTASPVQGIVNATSGYLSVNDNTTNSKLFYVFYQCRNLTKDQDPIQVPILIWLQGGPGGSSQTGSFYEMGPYMLIKNESSGKN